MKAVWGWWCSWPIIAVFIVVQNTVGIGLASLLGLDPLIGLVAGSITLVGGHGTAGAWGSVLEGQYGLTGATTLGMACATFGLVIGGLLGGPLAKRLITRHQLAQARRDAEQLAPSRPTVPEGGERSQLRVSLECPAPDYGRCRH